MIVGVVGFGSLDPLLTGPRPGGYLRVGEIGSRASHLLRGNSRPRVLIKASKSVQDTSLAIFLDKGGPEILGSYHEVFINEHRFVARQQLLLTPLAASCSFSGCSLGWRSLLVRWW